MIGILTYGILFCATVCSASHWRVSKPYINRLSNINSTSFTVSWDRPQLDNEEIIRYDVETRPRYSAGDRRLQSTRSDTHSLALHNLRPHTSYIVLVTAVCRSGLNVRGYPQPILTDVAPPAPPVNLKLIQVTPRSVLVEWRLPSFFYNKVDSYEVEILSETVGRLQSRTTRGTKMQLRGLKPGERFLLRVSAVTRSVYGRRLYKGEPAERLFLTPSESTTKRPSTKRPEESTTNSPEESTTIPPEESTINSPEESTINSPEESTTNPPEESTTNSPEEPTSNPPEESTTNPPEEYTTNPPDESTTNPPEESTTNPPEESTTNPSEESTTNPPEESTTNPPEESTISSSEESTTNPLEGSTTNSPQRYSPNSLKRDITNLPERYTTNPSERFTKDAPKRYMTSTVESYITRPPTSYTKNPLERYTSNPPERYTTKPSKRYTTEPSERHTTISSTNVPTTKVSGPTTTRQPRQPETPRPDRLSSSWRHVELMWLRTGTRNHLAQARLATIQAQVAVLQKVKLELEIARLRAREEL